MSEDDLLRIKSQAMGLPRSQETDILNLVAHVQTLKQEVLWAKKSAEQAWARYDELARKTKGKILNGETT